MKIVLMGTNSWVVPIFDFLYKQYEILAVFTTPPKTQGRGLKLIKSAVHKWADSLNIKVHTNINEYNYNADCIIVISYGVIIPQKIFSSTKCLNIHPSLLPKYRGASPIKTALLNGDLKSGVCLIDVVKNIDSGGVYICKQFNIDINDTNDILEEKIIDISKDILKMYLSNPLKYYAIEQKGEVSFTRKFTKNDLKIDWNNTKQQIHNQIRAIGGVTYIKGLKVKIIKTKLINNELYIEKIQPEGKKIMSWVDFKNGYKRYLDEGFYCVKI